MVELPWFFHGGASGGVEFSICDSHHSKSNKHKGTNSGACFTFDTGIDIDTMAEALAADGLPTSATTWLGDTGASHHICHRKEFFTNLQPLDGPFKIKQVQGTVDVTHHGTVTLQVDTGTGKYP